LLSGRQERICNIFYYSTRRGNENNDENTTENRGYYRTYPFVVMPGQWIKESLIVDTFNLFFIQFVFEQGRRGSKIISLLKETIILVVLILFAVVLLYY